MRFIGFRYLVKCNIIVLLLLPIIVFSQSEVKRAIRAQEKKEKLDVKNDYKSQKEGKKNVKKIQTKEVRKRMKQSAKRSKRIRENRRDPFYERWTNHKRRKVKHKEK